MEAKMANINVPSMAFACENGGCHKRFRPLVPKLNLSSTTTPMANAVWSQQSHDHQYQQQSFSSTTASTISLSAAACLLDRKTNRMNAESEENINEGNGIDRLISINIGDHQQNMKEEAELNCAQSHPSGTRWNPTAEQIRILEMFYKGGMRTPNAEQIEHITAQLRHYGKIEGKNVFYWFQNHKARERQKQKRNNMIAAKTRVALTAITPDSPNEVVQTSSACSNGAYSLYNYLPLPTLTETSQPMFNSSALLSMPCSKGLALDFRTPTAFGVLKHEDLSIKGSGSPDQIMMTNNLAGRASRNSTWDAINTSGSVNQHGEGILSMVAAAGVKHPYHEEPAIMRLNQISCEKNAVVNSCKRKSRLWQTPNEIMEERCLSLHPESSSESICLQTSDPQTSAIITVNDHDINPSSAEIIDEEDIIDRQVQTLQLFPLHPEGCSTLKSQGGDLHDDPPHDFSCSLQDFQADQRSLSFKENSSELFEFLPKNIF